jgi:rubrerythrin
VQLLELLARSQALEKRAAAMYRTFAATDLADPDLAALWTALAAEEDAHASSIEGALGTLDTRDETLTAIEDCEQALADIAERLWYAERLPEDATADRRFTAALDIELSELTALRRLAVDASPGVPIVPPETRHLHRLGETAMKRSSDAHVRLAAALLLARQSLAADIAVRR